MSPALTQTTIYTNTNNPKENTIPFTSTTTSTAPTTTYPIVNDEQLNITIHAATTTAPTITLNPGRPSRQCKVNKNYSDVHILQLT